MAKAKNNPAAGDAAGSDEGDVRELSLPSTSAQNTATYASSSFQNTVTSSPDGDDEIEVETGRLTRTSAIDAHNHGSGRANSGLDDDDEDDDYPR